MYEWWHEIAWFALCSTNGQYSGICARGTSYGQMSNPSTTVEETDSFNENDGDWCYVDLGYLTATSSQPDTANCIKWIYIYFNSIIWYKSSLIETFISSTPSFYVGNIQTWWFFRVVRWLLKTCVTWSLISGCYAILEISELPVFHLIWISWKNINWKVLSDCR